MVQLPSVKGEKTGNLDFIWIIMSTHFCSTAAGTRSAVSFNWKTPGL